MKISRNTIANMAYESTLLLLAQWSGLTDDTIRKLNEPEIIHAVIDLPKNEYGTNRV